MISFFVALTFCVIERSVHVPLVDVCRLLAPLVRPPKLSVRVEHQTRAALFPNQLKMRKIPSFFSS